MKKKLLGLAAALAALGACTKTTVYEDGQTEIAFQPVAEQVTKTVYGPMTGTYNTGEAFRVYAYHKIVDPGKTWSEFYGDGTGVQTYIDNQEFTHRGDNKWGGGYYWPKTGSLMFAGYSPSGITSTSQTYTLAENPVLTIEDFVQGTYSPTENNTVDLMWFNANDAGMQSVNYSASATTAVPVKFHHALAWLTFKFTSDITDHFYLTEVTLDQVYHKGDFAGKYATSTLVAEWTNQEDPVNYVLHQNSTGTLLSATATTADNLLVIPYDFTSAVSGNYQLTIKFKQGGDGQLEQTQVFQLNSSATKKWEPGKHYTYNISFTAQEILINPSVDDWGAETVGDITVK